MAAGDAFVGGAYCLILWLWFNQAPLVTIMYEELQDLSKGVEFGIE